MFWVNDQWITFKVTTISSLIVLSNILLTMDIMLMALQFPFTFLRIVEAFTVISSARNKVFHRNLLDKDARVLDISFCCLFVSSRILELILSDPRPLYVLVLLSCFKTSSFIIPRFCMCMFRACYIFILNYIGHAHGLRFSLPLLTQPSPLWTLLWRKRLPPLLTVSCIWMGGNTVISWWRWRRRVSGRRGSRRIQLIPSWLSNELLEGFYN